MAFSPRPGDSISYKNEPLFFVQHPGMKDPFVLREEGKRGTVYQLSNGAEKWALKVFKKLYRKPHQLEIARKLGPLVGITGMMAAKRTVFEEGHPLVVAHPDLLHAQMMPWVHGFTWFNVLNVGGLRNCTYLQPAHAARLCHRFILVMSEIERRGVAHTDIASGNVIVDVDAIGVELIDLEEMFGPGFPRPAKLNAGSAGYGHRTLRDPSCSGLWSAECDRFALAILAAEMLLFSSAELSALCDQGGGYFSDDEIQSNSPRYQRALDYLRHECPVVADLFQRAWESSSISDCAPAEEWVRALEPIVTVAPAAVDAGLVPRSSAPRWRISTAFRTVGGPVTSVVAPPPEVDGVSWHPPSWVRMQQDVNRDTIVTHAAPKHHDSAPVTTVDIPPVPGHAARFSPSQDGSGMAAAPASVPFDAVTQVFPQYFSSNLASNPPAIGGGAVPSSFQNCARCGAQPHHGGAFCGRCGAPLPLKPMARSGKFLLSVLLLLAMYFLLGSLLSVLWVR
jgi:hypothetical protein